MFSLSKNKKPSEMWLLVGLGNPGDKYARNRHNIGFMVIDAIADGFSSKFSKKFHGQFAEFKVQGQSFAALKPQTYMNESGQSVGAAAKFYKIPAERIVVFHDELDLKPGEIKIKKGGGNAGHNGLKSIQAHLGTPDFWRVRMGIGHPGQRDQVSDYVLSDFAKADKSWLDLALEAASAHYSVLVEGGMDAYAARVYDQLEKK